MRAYGGLFANFAFCTSFWKKTGNMFGILFFSSYLCSTLFVEQKRYEAYLASAFAWR